MSDTPERTAGGLTGRLAGKAKETAGSLTGNEELAREGRLQQTASDAQIEARQEAAEARQAEQEAELSEERVRNEEERKRLENELSAEQREEQAARDRAAGEARAAEEA